MVDWDTFSVSAFQSTISKTSTAQQMWLFPTHQDAGEFHTSIPLKEGRLEHTEEAALGDWRLCLRLWSPQGGSWAHSLEEPSSRRRGGTHNLLATSQLWVTGSSGSGACDHLSSARGTHNCPPSIQPPVAAPGNLMTPNSSQLSPSLHAVEPVTQEILDPAEVPQSLRWWHQQQQGTATLEVQAATARAPIRAMRVGSANCQR